MIVLPFPFMPGLFGVGPPQDEVDKIEILFSVSFLFIFIVSCVAALLAWFNTIPYCLTFHRNQCDVLGSTVVTALATAILIMVGLGLFLSVRKLYRLWVRKGVKDVSI